MILWLLITEPKPRDHAALMIALVTQPQSNGAAHRFEQLLGNANLAVAVSCGSACKRDPVSGVIGVQKGTTIPMV